MVFIKAHVAVNQELC